PPKGEFGSVVISPDGRWIAFTDVSPTGQGQIWIRALDAASIAPRRLGGTAGATNPFWSPDSKSLGFFADNQLKTIDIAGGAARSITPVGDNRGGTWNRDGTIVFARDIAGPLYHVSVKDPAPPAPLTTLDREGAHAKDGTHRWPHFLPDGRHFLYFV